MVSNRDTIRCSVHAGIFTSFVSIFFAEIKSTFCSRNLFSFSFCEVIIRFVLWIINKGYKISSIDQIKLATWTGEFRCKDFYISMDCKSFIVNENHDIIFLN